MDILEKEINILKERIVEEALNQSSTYRQAYQLIGKCDNFTSVGLSVKKVIQDEIIKRALDSKIR